MINEHCIIHCIIHHCIIHHGPLSEIPKCSNPNSLATVRKLSESENGNLHMHICSVNNFPTAAGLASSAAGYACLAYAIGQVLEVTDVRRLSIISRMGSGSACRSLYGGFVQWVTSDKSEESYAKQVVDEFYWPKMRIIVLVVNDAQKDTPSTAGMQLTAETSTLFQHRISSVVPKRVQEMVKAIKDRNFHQFAEITMKDSNQFHACCQDSYPPIRYMNDTSWSIVSMVHKLNQFYGTNRLAYTFDAGPNACIYLLESEVDQFLTLVNRLYPSTNDYQGEQAFRESEINGDRVLIENELDLTRNVDNGYYRGLPYRQVPLKENLLSLFKKDEPIQLNQLKGIISTRIGTGPQVQMEGDSLLNEDGLPKMIA